MRADQPTAEIVELGNNLSPVSHWCVCDLSNSCPFYTLLELCVPDSESKREIKEMCNAFKERSVRFLFASPHVQVLQNGLTANWCESRQTSTKPSLTMYRVNSQGCSEDVAVVHQWNLKSSRQESGQSAIGLKSHVSSLATLGRIFWRNADLGTFAKFNRGNSRTFNQVVPKICRAKCTHRHRHPQSLAAFDRIHWLHLLHSGGLAFYRWIQMDKSKFSAKLGWNNSRIQGNWEVKSQKWWQ